MQVIVSHLGQKSYCKLPRMDGADMAFFEDSSVISENFMALLAPSGEELLLVSDSTQTLLPLFPSGWRFATLSLAMG